ncbi:MAG: hypothetical protein ACE5KF_02365 [Kiloniellaceae bacterium]
MSERSEPRAAAGPEGSLSAWWWLWLPLAAALALLAVPHVSPAAYGSWIGGERGLLEWLHVVIPLASLAVGLRILAMPEVRAHHLLWLWVGLATLGSLYIAGEEASWGQHYLRWTTPEPWQAINDQGETNLHNTSSWLDQKPRAVLELGVVVGGILVPLAALCRPAIRQARLAIILPPMICLPSALLAEFARMSERAAEYFGAAGDLFDRASEVQETYFYLFILLYLIVLRRRVGEPVGDHRSRAETGRRRPDRAGPGILDVRRSEGRR